MPHFFQILHGGIKERDQHYTFLNTRLLYVCLWEGGTGKGGSCYHHPIVASWICSLDLLRFCNFFRWEQRFPPTSVLRDCLSAAAEPIPDSLVYKRVKPYCTIKERERKERGRRSSGGFRSLVVSLCVHISETSRYQSFSILFPNLWVWGCVRISVKCSLLIFPNIMLGVGIEAVEVRWRCTGTEWEGAGASPIIRTIFWQWIMRLRVLSGPQRWSVQASPNLWRLWQKSTAVNGVMPICVVRVCVCTYSCISVCMHVIQTLIPLQSRMYFCVSELLLMLCLSSVTL